MTLCVCVFRSFLADRNGNSTDVVIPETCEDRPGYGKYRGSCYKLVDQPKTFVDAQAFCRQERAWLATARDGFYDSALTLLVNWYQPTPEYVWIGLRQVSKLLS